MAKQNNPLRKDRKIVNTSPAQTRIKGSTIVQTVYGDSLVSVFLDYLGFKTSNEVPRLAANCEYFERWFVHMFKLEFVPTVPVTQAGTIHIAPDYDPLDQAPTDSLILSRNMNYTSGPISSPLVCNMPNMKQPDGAYLRPDMFTSPTNNERLVQYGFFTAITEGVGSAMKVGNLVLHYDITFTRPQSRETGISFSVGVPDRIFRDGTGGAWARGVDTVGGTTVVGGIHMEKSSASVSLPPYHTISAVIDTIESGINLYNSTLGIIREGARIFIRAAANSMTSAGVNTTLADSAYVGEMATSRTFDPSTVISMNTSSVNGFTLKDVISLGSAW